MTITAEEAKARVLDKHPDAVAHDLYGAWSIWPDKIGEFRIMVCLGRELSEDAAWLNAYQKMINAALWHDG
jgi:hypothetical protein